MSHRIDRLLAPFAIALALGARAVGMARPFLLAALEDRAADLVEKVIAQLRIATWAAGAARPGDLRPEDLDRR